MKYLCSYVFIRGLNNINYIFLQPPAAPPTLPGTCPADILTHSPGLKLLNSPALGIDASWTITAGCTLPPLQAAGAGLAYRITILHTQATRNHRTGCWSGTQGGAGEVQLKCSFSMKSTHRKVRKERKDIVTLTLRPLRSLRYNITLSIYFNSRRLRLPRSPAHVQQRYSPTHPA